MKYTIKVIKETERSVEMPHMRPSFVNHVDEQVLFSANMDADIALEVINLLHYKQLDELKKINN